MNKKKQSTMPAEYRIGMISAFSLMLLSIVLPLVSVSESGMTIRVSLFNFFTKSNLEQSGLMSLDGSVTSLLNTIRALIIIFALMAILGIVCYVMEFPTKVKEGVIIALIQMPKGFFIGVWTLVFAAKSIASYAGGAISLGIGAIIGGLACLYAFYRPIVYLCMQKSSGQSAIAADTIVAQLKGISGIYAGQSIPMEAGEKIVIGRGSEECNLIVDAPKVSRKHCEITFDSQSGVFLLNDFSSNGLYKNDGEKYRTHAELTSGDVFFLGNKENGFQVRVKNN